MRNQLFLPLSEPSQVGDARRKTVELAKGLGGNEAWVEKAAIIVTELATNLVKHAGGGLVSVRAVKQHVNGLELIALDKGPGIANIAECFRDGYSTVGSPGQGLGAIKRLASFFELYSQPGAGTVQFAQLWEQPVAPSVSGQQFRVSGICQPKRGEIVSGDAWAAIEHAGRSLLLVADGLGHGPDAAVAAREAVQIFEANATLGPAQLLELIHLALRPTRGAAVAIAEILIGQQRVKFAGIGNISGSVISPPNQVRHMVSHNGVAGHEARKFQEFSYPWTHEASLVLHSDGLNTRFRTEAYPGLTVRHPGIIAGVLFRDFDRKTDDATVVVAKESV